ncbi:dephospho-CoA kinase [Blastopirellula marina]|uniref:Dephospho-CoA kinase n=1 Tax=Blastopirellula marina TaxID=124 RepID=A0A2S8FCU7_9BACT|nr:dephospho-CoA kinase [Blastopirellula marina]PQO29993.1 dephospho-CoA kinase [Blastopirellula marina]PTL42462.1 dephospho-CoA kinase [Blastopirellula marina]
MKTIGILGGIASGKSAATKILQELGAEVFDADLAGHRVLEIPEVKEEIRARFSSAVFDDQGNVSRPKLAALVFGDSPEQRQALADLEKISHPRIGAELQKSRNQAEDRGVIAFVVDAPVMIKAGWIEHCDHVLFIDASRETRLKRALARNWTENEFDIRESAQEELDVKRHHADFVIANDGDLSQLRDEVSAYWRQQIATSLS